MDEGLNADGSQPEFDFDDIEAPQPKAVAQALSAIKPVMQVEETRDAVVGTVIVAAPSPAVAAAQAVAMAVEANDSLQADAVETPIIASIGVVAEPDVVFGAVPSEPVAAIEPVVASTQLAPDSEALAPQSVSVAAATPTAMPAFESSAPVAWIEEPVVAPVLATPEPAVAAVEADVPDATFADVASEEPAAASAESDASSRAEQLRGLFDTARITPQASVLDVSTDPTSRSS